MVRATGTNVVNVMNADLGAHRDYFYVQLAVEPQSGTLCFSAEGIEGSGTQAAGYYVPAVIGPSLSTYTKTWYVYQWVDTNADSIANDGDSSSCCVGLDVRSPHGATPTRPSPAMRPR